MTKKETNLASFNNQWYKHGRSSVTNLLWYLISVVFFKSAFPFNKVKVFWLRAFGAKIGRGVVIKPHVNIKYPWLLQIGNYVWIGEHVWIDNLAKVLIEDHVCVSQGAMLLCGNHHYKKTTFDLIIGEIKLSKGTWIGAKSVVCPGVTAGSHAVLTVGSIATSHLKEYTIYQGNPAQAVKERILKE
ncbi:MAG: WcaF family extracellular polysaccharide biosynthesis acetyltransferase [Bacteroidetes bacterium]|nr:WcaF family extracellular polysaccharide biosynthesis acetyltransferase [Bacteroidota bacterium]